MGLFWVKTIQVKNAASTECQFFSFTFSKAKSLFVKIIFFVFYKPISYIFVLKLCYLKHSNMTKVILMHVYNANIKMKAKLLA